MSTSSLRILFIDDDPQVLDTAPNALQSGLDDNDIKAEVERCSTFQEGIQRLQDESFHLAVIDLKFEPLGMQGNQVIAEILRTKILPIIVYSAFPNELDPGYEEHELIYTAPKKRIEHVVEKTIQWHSQKVFDFFSETGFLGSSIRTALQRTMWDHVSRYWRYLDTTNLTVLERTTGRILTTVLYDVFMSSPEYTTDTGEVAIHHGEIYIFQTPRKYLAVGDILGTNNEYSVVLTPACDLVPRGADGPKAQLVLLAAMQPLGDFAQNESRLSQAFDNLQSGPMSTKHKKAVEDIGRMMRHAWLNDAGQFFFLPPFADFPGGVIDFLRIRAEAYAGEARQELVSKRVVSLNREMSAELATRFARYMIRLGQSPYDTLPLIKAIQEAIGRQ